MSIERVRRLLADGLVERPPALIGAKTVQIVLFRQTLDFTVLRTEESREINYAATPRSTREPESIRRVAFLGSKQKAAESRRLQALLAEANRAAARPFQECYLKDNLCGACPRCALFGAVSTVAGRNEPNLKHRIEYGTAYSLRPYEDVCEVITFNAVDEKTQKTGQAFQSRPVVTPLALFPSIVALRSVSAIEAVLTLKTVLSTTSYGAESRVGGDMRNLLAGVVVGWEEILTPLELVLELSVEGINADVASVNGVLNRYRDRAAFKSRVSVLSEQQLDELEEAVRDVEINGDLLGKAYEDVTYLRDQQRAVSGGTARTAPVGRRGRSGRTRSTSPDAGAAPAEGGSSP